MSEINVINEFLPKQVNTTIYMMMLKISNGYDIYGDLKKLLVDFKKEELALYFPEMIKLLNDCKFHNCKHLNEPKCAVKSALDTG